MEILLFDQLSSTQTYVIEKLQERSLTAPIAVLALRQNKGIGSRDNQWIGGEGNLFASVAVNMSDLPIDLPLSSASIYLSFIMKKVLLEMGEEVWLKWPNDLYKNREKVGGTITTKVGDTLVCGIGINLKDSQNGYSALQSDISPDLLLEKYLLALEQFPKWKQVFSEYEVEFELSRKFSVHIENYQKSLENAYLQSDGSLIIDGRKVYSLR
ncbi:MAG: Biotin--[acetyl-CoA-carboxylase] ligase [uncultured Sulfurovum sp.]|uniref:Biotin--[acetyl-CoA-carboxylase] ligase n=1 Tax=uncultured Sulfurovum sp. TaxID=269237 RepID=A0A6S6S0S3_9BACT|nr:MAG: Biotin--[acetyl-CoA-carboxylase] ligase [uncultured Sulfurovum sp.]